MNAKQNPHTATLILVRGLPGSGKTHMSAALRQALGGEVVMLDPDATDYTSQAYLDHTRALTAEGVEAALHPYRFLRGQAYDAIAAGQTIIWNQPFTNLEIFDKVVARLRHHAKAHGVTLQLVVVEVEIDPAVAKQRVSQRKAQGGHGPSDDTFARFVRDYHSFAGHGYETVSVPGDDTASAVAAIIKLLRS